MNFTVKKGSEKGSQKGFLEGGFPEGVLRRGGMFKSQNCEFLRQICLLKALRPRGENLGDKKAPVLKPLLNWTGLTPDLRKVSKCFNVSRRCLERPLGEYDPLGVRPNDTRNSKQVSSVSGSVSNLVYYCRVRNHSLIISKRALSCSLLLSMIRTRANPVILGASVAAGFRGPPPNYGKDFLADPKR